MCLSARSLQNKEFQQMIKVTDTFRPDACLCKTEHRFAVGLTSVHMSVIRYRGICSLKGTPRTRGRIDPTSCEHGINRTAALLDWVSRRLRQTFETSPTGSDADQVTDYPDRCRESTDDYVTTASFYIPSNSMVTNHPIIRQKVVGATDKVAK
jgi:hypothetical protein